MADTEPEDVVGRTTAARTTSAAVGWAIVLLAAAIIAMFAATAADVFSASEARPPADAAGEALFTAEVLPVLRDHCFECHSHAAGKMKGGLALDWRSGWEAGGDAGPAVVPGKPDESLLVKAVRHADPDLKMPPTKKLADAEVAVLAEWVRRGAPDPRRAEPPNGGAGEWWSLKPLTRPAVPAVPSVPAADVAKGEAKAPNPIDAFVRAKLKERGLTPSPPADQRTLVRRVTFDLTGLPPTPEDVAAFVADPDAAAYDKLVDRLLASPRYGERWARHWLDAVHFADTHGFEHDLLRPNAWRYRDYVIDAFNRDTPWPRFVREQLAADAFYPGEPRLTAALGFLGAGPYDQSAANTAQRTFEYLDRDDLVNQTMATFAGATVACARCHAHKFDPIPQEDYYAVAAVFAGVGKGDVEYDADPAVAASRKRWSAALAAAEARDAGRLLSPEHAETVSAWGRTRSAAATAWRPATVLGVDTEGGTSLGQSADGTVEACGPHPDKDSYFLTVAVPVQKVTALRLDLLADLSLPANGPGRAENGNLKLSELEIRLLGPSEKAWRPGSADGADGKAAGALGTVGGRLLKLRRATADWEQEGFPAANAVDGNVGTAWGIHPREGESHRLVVELAEPLATPAGTRIAVALRQSFGRDHLIGKLRLSVTDASGDAADSLPPAVESALAVPAGQRSAAQRLELAVVAVRSRATAELAKLPPLQKVFAAGATYTSDRGRLVLTEPKPVFMFKRGDVDRPGAAASPGTLSAVAALPARFDLPKAAPESARRAALADWLVDPKNPLTWRTAANRVWLQHFGRGICDTPNDLGRMGGVPSNADLLDWLACELRDGDGSGGNPASGGGSGAGSLKHLHRLIVTSETYRQSSAARPDASAVDADDRLLWRFERRRLDAESYREAVLAAAGRLDLTMGGPGTQQFKLGPPVQLTPRVDYSAFDWDSPGAGRRGVYRVAWRALPDPFLDALDFPDASLLAPTRGFSASPQQALAMLNNDFVLRHAEHLAARAEKLGATNDEWLAAAWKLALQREPTAEERKRFGAYAKTHGLPAACRVIFNLNEFLFVD